MPIRRFEHPIFFSALVFLTALALYSGSLGHDFVLDDQAVLSKNAFVQRGVAGWADIFTKDSYEGFLNQLGVASNMLAGGRYRPVSLLFFAAIYEWIGADAAWFHAFAVLMYALCGILVFMWILQMTGRQNAAFAAALIFVTHPTHAEVGANIKSVDETLALIFALGGALTLRKNGYSGSFFRSLSAFVLFLAAYLSKESAIVWAVLLPLAWWRLGDAPWQKTLLRAIPPVAAAAVFLLLRMHALGDDWGGQMMHDPMNNPFLKPENGRWIPFSDGERRASLAHILSAYARLMIWPHPLTHDYFPFHITVKTWMSPTVWAGCFLALGAVISSVAGLWKKRVWGLGMAIIVLGLLPVSNIFFPVGVWIAERFLFLPTVGFALIFAVLWGVFPRIPAQIATFFLIGIFAWLTAQRIPDWRDNETLYRADIDVSSESAKINCNLGNLLTAKALAQPDSVYRKALLTEALPYLEKAVTLHPSYFEALQGLGANAFFSGRYETAVHAYGAMVQIAPDDANSIENLHNAHWALGNYFAGPMHDCARALVQYELALRLKSNPKIEEKIKDCREKVGK